MWLHIDSCGCVPFRTFWSLCPEHPGGFAITSVFISALMSPYELILPFIPNCSTASPADTVTWQPGRREVPRQTQGKTSGCDQMNGAGDREQGTVAVKGCGSENMVERQANPSSSELICFWPELSDRQISPDGYLSKRQRFIPSVHKHACVCMCAHTYRVTHPYSHEPSIPHMSTCISFFISHVQWSPDVPFASSCAHIQHIYTCLSLYASYITCPNIPSHAQNHISTCSMCHTPQPSLSCIPHTPRYTHTLTHSPSSYASRPQWYVLKFGCSPSKHRLGKVSREAAFQCAEPWRLPSWTEQAVCFGLMAHRYTPEVSHYSAFLGNLGTCHLSHVAIWKARDTLPLARTDCWDSVSAGQDSENGLAVYSLWSQTQMSTFLCARQFHLAVSETAYEKFRAEFISVTLLWEPGHFRMSLYVPCLLPGSTLGNKNVLKPALFFDTSDTLTAWHLQWILSAPRRQKDVVPLSHVPGVCLCLLSGHIIPVTSPWDADPAGHYLHEAVASLLQPQRVPVLSLTSLAHRHLRGTELWTVWLYTLWATIGEASLYWGKKANFNNKH